jgi:carbamate kinase
MIALGSSAFAKRGWPATIENQRNGVRAACSGFAAVAARHQLVLSHSNRLGQELSIPDDFDTRTGADVHLDLVDAGAQGTIGYLIEQQLEGILPAEKAVATVLAMIEVDAKDTAFRHPTVPVGPIYSDEVARRLAHARGWSFRADRGGTRRVVPSPVPRRTFESRSISSLLDHGCVVICAAGGGIPVIHTLEGRISAVEAVIDNDRASSMLAREVGAELLIMATDTAGVCVGFGTVNQRVIRLANPRDLLREHLKEFGSASMRPKVRAACDFVLRTGRPASIGSLTDIQALMSGTGGTTISMDATDVQFEPETGEPMATMRFR